MKTLTALITVRKKSTRLQNKCFLDFNDQTVLEHVINRCKEFKIRPIVSTTIDDSQIKSICQNLYIDYYAGSDNDKLDRWLQTCHQYKVDKFVTVDCDDLFFDKDIAYTAFEMLNKYDVILPNFNAYLGSFSYGFNVEALKSVCLNKDSENTEMIDRFIRNVSSLSLSDVFIKDVFEIEKKIRLTLDYKEDYWLLSVVLKNLGPYCNRQQIVDFFNKNQGLTIINEFRNSEWKARQLAQSV